MPQKLKAVYKKMNSFSLISSYDILQYLVNWHLGHIHMKIKPHLKDWNKEVTCNLSEKIILFMQNCQVF